MNRTKHVSSLLLAITVVSAMVCIPALGWATTVATPTFSPAAGSYGSSQTVTISDSTSGTTIYYTTNGTTPTTSSTKYTSAITVNSTETVEAIGAHTGDTNSAVASAAYTFVVPTPTLSPAAGTYGSSQSVTISDSNSAATIYYTTNGTTPTTSSTKYTGAITVNSTETVKALAVITGYTNSAVASAAYTFVVPTPTFSPAAGSYGSSQTVTIGDLNSAATIYYTTNGTTPTTSSTKYTAAITVNSTETVEAIAVITGYTNSAVASAAYTFVAPTPTFSLAGGSYFGSQTVTISDSNSAATIYYTTNGTTPTTSSTKYTAAIMVNSTETVEAIAVVTGYTNSAVATVTYTITTTPGTLNIYLSPPAAQSTTVSGALTETFDALTAKTYTTPYVSAAGIGTYTGSSADPYAIVAPNEYGGAIDSTSSTPTNYFAVGTESGSENPVTLALKQPVSYFGFWWSAGDAYNRVALYSGSSLYGTFSTADLLSFLNNGSGTITASNGSVYNTSAYFGNPNITSGSNDSGEPFAYVSFAITGATITQIEFYNDSTSSGFETDNHSVIFNGNTVTIPTTFVPVESKTLGSRAAAPVFTPQGGNPLNLGISSTTAGASINYTTNGTAPTPTTGTVCGTPCIVQVTAAETIEAIAYETGITNSTVTSVTYAVPTISAWPTASGIIYGQTLASSTLTGGTGSVGGTFAWTTPTSAPTAGTQSESVTFTPTNEGSYIPVTGSVNVVVSKATPTVTANPTASPITYGQTLASSTLSGGTASVPGTFAWTTPTTAPSAGTPSESVTFTPTDSTDYSVVTVSITLTVNGISPTVTVTSTSGTYGTPLTLTATSTYLNNGVVTATGQTPSYVLISGPATLSNGVLAFTGIGSVVVTASVSATGNFAGATSAQTTVTVSAVTPTVTVTSTSGTYGTPLTLTATSTYLNNGVATGTGQTPSYVLVSGPATLSSGVLTFTGTGSVVVTASVSATGDFAAATSAQTTVTVVAAPSYTIAASPASLGIVQGAIGTDTITVTGANGFTGSVTLSASGLPSGVTAAFATNPTAGSSILTLTASGAATVGNATITVTGTSGGLTASTTIALTVTAPQCIASYQRTIVIDHTKVPNTDQVNFPFLFNTTDPAFATISNGGHIYSPTGDDIVFSADPNGVTKLDYELEEYDPVHGQVIAWIRIPTLSHTADTVLYMFYGNSSITTPQQNPTGVWDTNYVGVWHLPNGSILSANDSTANGSNGTAESGVSAAPGFIDGGANFNGSSTAYISLPTYSNQWNFAGDMTLSAWVKTTGNGLMVMQIQDGNPLAYLSVGGTTAGGNSNDAVAYFRTNTGGVLVASGNTIVNDGNWHHIQVVRSTGQAVLIYVDGVLDTTTSYTDSGPISDSGGTAIIGGSGSYGFNGLIDEARVSNFARTGNWIATEYSNQSAPGSFYALSAESLDSSELVTPTAVSLYASQNQQFAMLGVGTCSSVAVNWAINPPVGTINATGLYSTPATISAQQTVTVTATNQANNTSASATVTLMPSSGGPAGTVVTINGAGFGSAEGTSTVTVGGLPAVALSWSDAQIQVQIPSGTGLGNQNVLVTVNGQLSASITFDVTPGITGITPSSNGIPGSVDINTPGQTGQLIFNGVAGQLANAQISNSTFPGCVGMWINILNPDGSNLASQLEFPCNSAFANPVTLPTTGTYTLIFSPLNGATGTVNFDLWEFQNLTGTITFGTPTPVTISYPGQFDQLSFSGAAGQVVSAQISNSTYSYCADVIVNILNPDGSTLTSQFEGLCGGTTFVSPVTLPTAGTYTLVIAPVNGATGSATFTLWGFQNVTGMLTSGTPVPVSIELPGQNEQLTFSGIAGQVASVQISPSTSNGNCLSGAITLLNPNGSTLASWAACIGGPQFFGPLTLPTTGTYTLLLVPFGGATGSSTVELTLAYPNVTMSASLVPVESWFGNSVSVNVTLTAQNEPPPTGTVNCSEAGANSASVTVNSNGTATVPMNGLPIGKDSIVCSYSSNNSSSYSNAVSPAVIEWVSAAPDPGTVSITPSSATLYGGQTEQFSASVFNTTNQAVTWTVSPSGAGTINGAGLYTAPATVNSSQTVTITAISQANTTQSASAVLTLSLPQCASRGYSYQRTIVIDHTKVPNTDQADFPFLFNTTDPTLATTANGGHLTSSSGYDIIFSTDPSGLTKLDHELEEYNPVTGQVVAWVRIPTLSHTADTVLYVFYGNQNVTSSQQNPSGVWDANYTAVYHLANVATGTAADSTANGNNGALTEVSAGSGEVDGGASLNGVSSFMQIPAVDFQSYPTSGSTTTGFSASFGTWFKTASAGVILGQTDGTEPGVSPSGSEPALYVDTVGMLRASLFSHGGTADQIVTSTAYNDNNWHFAVDTYTNGIEELYVDGQYAGSQQVSEVGYNSSYAYFAGTGETANWPAANGSWLYFNGVLDEVKVSNIARSGDWIQTEFSNQSSPSTFYALYPENAEEVIPTTVNLSASQSQQFTILGSTPGLCSSPAVIWSMPAGLPGTLTASGIYTAPNSVTSEQTVTVTATTLGDSSASISATVTLMPAVTVSLTPANVTLNDGQAQQFTASVGNTTNTAVTWTSNPAGTGVFSETGLYTAPVAISTQRTVTITATSQADPTQSVSATITLPPAPIALIPPSSPQCGSSGYGYQRVVVIDHTKVPNTDQTDFPFLFNTTDPSLATIANGGQVASPNGYDIIFSTDPNGLTKLDHELEEYNPVTGQVIAWVRIPTLSHTTDTVLYVFYGNSNIIASQQNLSGVWNSNYLAVYHLANTGAGSAVDSTALANNGTLVSVSPSSGAIDGAAAFNGASSFMKIPEADFPNYPTGVYDDLGLPNTNDTTSFSASVGVWFKTASAGGILMQFPNPDCSWFYVCTPDYNPQPGDVDPLGWNAMLYVDDNGSLRGGGVVSTAAYNDNNWHFAVVTYATNGDDLLYVDGRNVGSAQQEIPVGYAPNYAYFVGAEYTFQIPEGNWNWQYFNGSIDEVTISDIPRSGDWIQTEYNNQGSPSTFYTFGSATTVQAVPSAISLYATQSEQFAVAGTCNAAVTWSMPSGTQGTLTSSGLYTAAASITATQTVTITATSQATGTAIASSIVTLQPPPTPIVLAAAAQPPYTTGSSQAFTVTLQDQDGNPEIGVPVTFTVVGSNSIIGSGTISGNGMATYTYTGANSGTDTIQATASVSGQLFTSNNVSATWIAPSPSPAGNVTLVAPPALGLGGLIGAFTDNNGNVIEPISIGAARQAFVVPAGATQLQLGVNDNRFGADGGSGFVVLVNGVSVTIPPTALPWNWVAGGLNSNYQYGPSGGLNANYLYGLNDATGPVPAAKGLSAGESITVAYQSGTASANFPVGALVNANGDPANITGGQILQGTYFPTLYTNASAYPVGQAITFHALVTDDSGAPIPDAPVTLTVQGANPGQYQATTDSTGTATFIYSGSNAGTDSLQAQAETGPVSNLAGVTWVNFTAPPLAAPLPLTLLAYVNNVQTYTVLVTDASGNPVANASVGLYVWGADNIQLSAVTDITGHTTLSYTHVNAGTYNVMAVDSVDRNPVFSSIVSGQWPSPSTSSASGSTINVSISAQNAVTLPSTLQLNGTVTDNAGVTPTVVWSQVSGPGTVTFANPQQAVTTASFSQDGIYVVELSASDSISSASAQFQVTVNPAPVQEAQQGWLGSPIYGSAVSGIVPITVSLPPGVSLQSGTLIVYPANSPLSATVLNANTTGSSQIGVLDTTVLPNGSYRIQLQATDTAGQSQYSLVQVTVAGNYKPGRVTATVTDLVVPATGLAINIQRTYDSLNAGTSSDFGYGWSLGINVNLTVDPAGNVTFTLGGQRKTFYFTPQAPSSTLIGAVFNYYLPAYTPEPGLYGTLTDGGTGCGNSLDLLTPEGSASFCSGTGAQYGPSQYVYTDANGTSYTMGMNGMSGTLQSIQDRSGNGLTIGPNGITSKTGLSVPFVRDSNNRITQITDPQGNIYSYTYDASGNLASVTYPNTAQPSTYTYDSNHLYLSGTDFRNNPLPSSTYYTSADTDPNGLPLNGRLQSVSDALGETTSYAYNLATNTTTVTYPSDASDNIGTATMVYDNYGMLLSSTDPLGHTTTNVYDTNHNLLSVTDPLGHTNSYTYDSSGNKTSSTYPATATSTNTTSSTVYNQYSEPTSTTDELGNVRTFNYDGNYNPQSVTDSAGTLASFLFNANATLAAGAIGFDISANPAQASQFAYDANGNMTSRTDALGRTTSYTYDSLGRKVSTTVPPPVPGASTATSTTYQYDSLGNLIQTAAPLGRTTSSTYDANNNKISDTDARGNITTYQYDALNRLSTTTYPATSSGPATTSTRTYDFRNNVVTETDQAGNVTKHVYDPAGRQKSVTRGFNSSTPSTTMYALDAAGRKTGETDALGHTTAYTYDADNRLIAISGVKGNFAYAYDDAGNRISQTDGNSNTTQFQYDARKRLVKTTYPDTTTVTNTYDGPGNLASVTDQSGNVVQYTYDAANQLKTVVQVNSPNTSNNTNSYGYDNLGDLAGLTDENLHTTQNAFNVLTEPISKTLPDGTLAETRQYDAAGNLTSLTHFNGVTTTYTYDTLNRLLSRATPGEPTVSFTYTATGKRATMTDASGTTSYSYDSLDRLTAKATPEGTLNYTYDAAGNVASVNSNHTNGVSVSYAYDELNRLSTVTDGRLQGNQMTTYAYDPASNVTTVSYANGVQSSMTYDALNRITGLATQSTGYLYQRGSTGNLTGATELNGRALSWNYDGIYRLTNETISSDPSHNNGSASYTLDPVGNRLSETSTLAGLDPGTFGYNADDEANTETYDANGNTVATGGKTFAYDAENHLTSMNSGAVTIVYDGDGNRVAKTVSGVTTQYLVDALNPTGYSQVVEEVVNGTVTRQYTYGLQRIDENQFVSGAWTPSFYGYDGGGNVRQLTNSAGVVTDAYEYDAFGNSFAKTGSTPNNYLYRGEQYDPDLGLYYLRARYYNAATGRFTSRDPEDGKAADPKTLHKYLYAGGDPINAVDPTGRDLFETALIEGGSLQGPIEAAIARAITPYVIKTLACTAYELLWNYVTPNGSHIPTPWDCWGWANGS
jgi:RHS repeat-associated protein